MYQMVGPQSMRNITVFLPLRKDSDYISTAKCDFSLVLTNCGHFRSTWVICFSQAVEPFWNVSFDMCIANFSKLRTNDSLLDSYRFYIYYFKYPFYCIFYAINVS